jgi:AraC family transcriptional regulator
MEPKIVDRGAFKVMGVIGHFASAAENMDSLWDEYMSLDNRVKPLSTGVGHYGIYLGADHSKPLDYLVGRAVQDATGAPEGVEVREVPAAQYAVFECSFQAIGRTYGYIWGEWLPSSVYEQDVSKFGFDYFPPGTTDGDSPIEIWVPIKRKGR